MRPNVRHALSILVTAVFVALAFGSSKPSPEEEKRRADEKKTMRANYDDWVVKLGVVYGKLAALPKDGLADKACDGAAMLKTAKEDTYLSLPTVYGPFMARFASKNKADWKEDKGPWAFLTESTVRERFAKHADDSDANELDSAGRFVTNDWMKNRFVIVLWPEDEKANKLPVLGKANSFDSGVFKGWLFIVDPIDSSITCQKRLSVENSETVIRGQLWTRDPKKAIQVDFEERFGVDVKAALPPNVKSSNRMGSILQ